VNLDRFLRQAVISAAGDGRRIIVDPNTNHWLFGRRRRGFKD
jgi:hypothetical protein